MTKSLDPFRFLITVSGWMNQQQLQLIDYLREEIRVLREQLGQKRLRFNDDQRRRLAFRIKLTPVLHSQITIGNSQLISAYQDLFTNIFRADGTVEC
jgi:hypothetical protein